jgi:hypothetical protein
MEKRTEEIWKRLERIEKKVERLEEIAWAAWNKVAVSNRLVGYTVGERELYEKTLQANRQKYLDVLNGKVSRSGFSHIFDSQILDFWDVVVITAFDDVQKQLYEDILAEKLLRREIPNTPKYHVLADPPGPRIGSGGATLAALDFLERAYPQQIDSCTHLKNISHSHIDKILLVHAGGYSKRLPNHTMSGKIFCPIPFVLNDGKF